jgi:hypothetical protein
MPYAHPARPGDRPKRARRIDLVIVTCAISAGVHGALAPEHFQEGTASGLGFVVATVLLASLAVWLTSHPDDRRGLAGVAIVLVGLLASYALAVTTGLPVLHPEPEPIDGLALVTKAIELAGLTAAVVLLWRRPAIAFARPQTTQPKGI